MGKVLFVIVIYQIKQEQSLAWQQLQALPIDDLGIVYVHDNTDSNRFLAAAYNEAWRQAKEQGCEWIVLLDADTAVTEQYIDAVRSMVKQGETNAVYCPELMSERGKVLSPLQAYGMKVAFNSGLLIPLQVIQQVGGFNEDYPLDYLDYWFCHQIHLQHIPMVTMSVRLLHSLSVQDYTAVPQWRYLSLLAAEKRFAKEMGRERRYKIRLFCRLVKWTLTGHKYIRETYRALVGKA